MQLDRQILLDYLEKKYKEYDSQCVDIHLDFDTYIACTGISKIVNLIIIDNQGYGQISINPNALKNGDDIKMAEYILQQTKEYVNKTRQYMDSCQRMKEVVQSLYIDPIPHEYRQLYYSHDTEKCIYVKIDGIFGHLTDVSELDRYVLGKDVDQKYHEYFNKLKTCERIRINGIITDPECQRLKKYFDIENGTTESKLHIMGWDHRQHTEQRYFIYLINKNLKQKIEQQAQSFQTKIQELQYELQDLKSNRNKQTQKIDSLELRFNKKIQQLESEKNEKNQTIKNETLQIQQSICRDVEDIDGYVKEQLQYSKTKLRNNNILIYVLIIVLFIIILLK